MTIVQRSPNVGIGIRLQPLVPEVKAPEPTAPPELPLVVRITDVNNGTSGGTISSVQTVTFSQAFESDKIYRYTLENVTVDASVFVVDSVDFSNGVFIAGADSINVPAGVSEFEVTVTITSTLAGEIRLQVQIINVFGLTVFVGV